MTTQKDCWKGVSFILCNFVHVILIQKLNYYGVRVSISKSIDGFDFKEINYGVPKVLS